MAGDPLIPQLSSRDRRRLLVLAAGVGIYVLAGLLRAAPRVVEVLYGTTLGPVVAQVLSRVTGILPFSLTEWIYPLYGSVLIRASWVSVRRWRAGEFGPVRLVWFATTRLARDVGVILILFYALWGFNYSRAPLEHRLGWGEWYDVQLEEASALADDLIERGNLLYYALHGTDDVGSPTELPLDRAALSRTLESGWRVAVEQLHLPLSMARRYGPVKTLLSDAIFARLGISGIYFPFTGEANVRGSLPGVAMPQSVAHEQAHQRGIGAEAEASFLGYVAAVSTDDDHVRYSAVLFAQRRVLNGIAEISRDRYRELNNKRSAGVKRDLRDLAEHYQQFVGVGTRVGSAVNDRFLRANRVEGGVLSYGLAGRLLIQYAREQQPTTADSLAPDPGAP